MTVIIRYWHTIVHLVISRFQIYIRYRLGNNSEPTYFFNGVAVLFFSACSWAKVRPDPNPV